MRKEPVPDRVPYGRSRAKGAGAGSRAIKCVAYERNWCRIACRQACRGRKEPVPDRVPYRRSWAKGAGVGSRVGAPVAHSRLVTSPLTSATSRLCGVHGRTSEMPVVGHAPAQQRL